MQRNAEKCSGMQWNAVKCSEMQWNAEKCSSAPPNPRCRSRPLEPRRHSNIYLANISTAKWNYNHKHNFETRSEIYITYFTTRSTSLLPTTDIMKDTMTDQLCDARVSLHNSQSLQKADWDWSYDNHEIHTFCMCPQITMIGALILTLVAFISLFLKNRDKCLLKTLGL